jgi:biopolymer transport protein ExbD
MQFRLHPKRHPTLESVALADIVMNLFLFFFITFSLVATFDRSRETKLRVELPQVRSGLPALLVTAHDIFITKEGKLLWDESELTLDQLRAELAKPQIKQLRLTLRADRRSNVQILVQVLEALRDAGRTDVALQTVLENRVKR